MLSKVSIHHFIGSECLIFVIQCTIFGCFIGVFIVIMLKEVMSKNMKIVSIFVLSFKKIEIGL